MNLLLTGGKGLLALTIKEIGSPKHNILNPGKDELDVTSFMSIISYLGRHKEVDIVIHCAAIIGYDKCENEKDLTYRTNYEGTANLSRICNDIPKPMIYISTDYVFDGETGNYKETDYTNPMTYYAKTKLMGEVATLARGNRVIRTSFCKKIWPYDNAYVDKNSSFDSVDIIADLILKVTSRIWSWTQVIHVGTEKKSFYDMAKKTKPDVIGTSAVGLRVPIPMDTSFNLDKLHTVLSKQESYK